MRSSARSGEGEQRREEKKGEKKDNSPNEDNNANTQHNHADDAVQCNALHSPVHVVFIKAAAYAVPVWRRRYACMCKLYRAGKPKREIKNNIFCPFTRKRMTSSAMIQQQQHHEHTHQSRIATRKWIEFREFTRFIIIIPLRLLCLCRYLSAAL